MSAEAGVGERTEEPTAKRLSDATKKGDVLASRELAVALVMIAGVLWLAVGGAALVEALMTSIRTGLSFDRRDIATFDIGFAVAKAAMPIAVPLAMLFGLTMVGAFAAPAMLGSLGFRSGGFAFKGNRINPLAGFGRMFGMQSVIGLGKSVANVVVVGGIGALVMFAAVDSLRVPVTFDVASAAAALGSDLLLVSALLVGGLAVIAMVDVPIQYAQRMKKLRMTKQEVRDEHKESDGSPEAKANLRQRRHLLLSQSTRKAVAEATVVLTNPTHFAVALRYRPGEDAAPQVVARGRGATALAIGDLARDNAVPVLSSPPLTRALYYTSRTGAYVREELYLAVAVVLAFVFNLDARVGAGIDAPDVWVPEGFRYDGDGRLGE